MDFTCGLKMDGAVISNAYIVFSPIEVIIPHNLVKVVFIAFMNMNGLVYEIIQPEKTYTFTG